MLNKGIISLTAFHFSTFKNDLAYFQQNMPSSSQLFICSSVSLGSEWNLCSQHVESDLMQISLNDWVYCHFSSVHFLIQFFSYSSLDFPLDYQFCVCLVRYDSCHSCHSDCSTQVACSPISGKLAQTHAIESGISYLLL